MHENERSGAGAIPAPAPAAPFHLPEPDLSYYLTLRRSWEQARMQAQTWEQALMTFQAALCRVYGFGPEDAIDERGVVHRVPEREPQTMNGSGASVEAGAWQPVLADP
jgi:hypothetical protein